MRGICGIFSAGNATVDEAELGTTAIRHAESGCSITADATLYYRDELLSALGPRDNLLDDRSTGDAELILAAYLRWGEECVEHLEGDFAFVIHDPRERKLFCARDAYGMRPLYYHYSPGYSPAYSQGGRFVFASDAREVLRNPQVPFAINEGRIADFIVEELEWLDLTSTFYEGIYRLPPAHRITIDAAGLKITEYRPPACGPLLNLATDVDYNEAFLDVFSRAVSERQRVRASEAGSMLSGGLDSGSIVALAKKPLHTYSLARRRGMDCDESRRIYATLDFLRLEGKQIIADEPGSLLEDLGADLAEPYDGHFLFLKAIYETAKCDGLNAVLDGSAGDLVFNEGAYVTRLMRRGRIAQAWHETVGEQAFWGGSSPAPAFLRYCASAFTPGFVKRLLRRPTQRRNERSQVKASLISPAFAEHVDIEARFERMRETFAGLQSGEPGLERVRKIRPNLTAGRERYGRIAASAGIEARDPFTDLRVVDFCSRLPDNQLARDGWPKFLLRNAMEGRLPDAVRWGRGKPHIGGVYNKNFLKRERLAGRLSLDGLRAALGAYVDSGALGRAWHEFEAGGACEPVHTAYILSLWLAQTARRPIVNGRGFG